MTTLVIYLALVMIKPNGEFAYKKYDSAQIACEQAYETKDGRIVAEVISKLLNFNNCCEVQYAMDVFKTKMCKAHPDEYECPTMSVRMNSHHCVSAPAYRLE